MKIIDKISKKQIVEVFSINDKIILQSHRNEGEEEHWLANLYENYTNNRLDCAFEIGFMGQISNKNLFIVFDKFDKMVNVIDLNKWEIINSYKINFEARFVQILSESLVLFLSDQKFIFYDFHNFKVVKEVSGENYRFNFNVNGNFFFIQSRIRTKIICLNVKECEKQWEIDLKNSDELFFKKEDNRSKIKSIEDLEILQFEVFQSIVIIRLRSHVLLCVEIETGNILWVNHDESYANFHQMLEFQISKKGEIYVLGDALNRKLRKFDINTGELIWQSENDWMKQAEITHSYISEFTMNEKYLFVASVSFGQILVIDKKTGLVVEKVNIYAKPKMIYGVVTKPTIFQNKLLIIVVGELFVFDISEYI